MVSLPADAADQAANVLVIYSNGRLLPVNVAGDRGFRDAIETSPGRPIVIFDEFLDSPRFDGEAYERRFAAYLQGKYADHPPQVVVAGGVSALRFILAHREALFARALIVHMGVSVRGLQSAPPLPAQLVGSTYDFDFAGTIQAALRFQPKAQRLVVVTGTSPLDRVWEAEVRDRVVPQFANTLKAEFWAGLPTATLMKRLSELDRDTVVLFAGILRDGEGRDVVGRKVAQAVASASAAPVYSPWDTHVGTGVIGGMTASFEDIGRAAGLTVTRLIGGTPPESLRLPEVVASRLSVDWRQVERWGIDRGAIPDDAVVRFRDPTFLESHWGKTLIALALILVQAGLIWRLLVERRVRRGAEQAVGRQRQELAHTSRLVVAAELTASIAHEINQPLGAILSNADAAELILKSDAGRHIELRAILADIRRDDLRASEVIRRLRTFMSKHEVEQQLVELNETARDTGAILSAEAQRRCVEIDVRPARAPCLVTGDRIQIQQVMINLMVNAMDAMADTALERRQVVVSIENADGAAVIVVRDHGLGIAPERLQQVFDSFYTTKQKGMGLGLSIARTIVDAHGGRIWAEHAPGGGTIFRVRLPASFPAPQPSAEPA